MTCEPPARPTSLPCRSLEAGLSRHRVPSLRARMSMRRRRHARGEDRLHVLRRVPGTGIHRERADLGDACTPGRAPSGDVDGEEPDFSERLDDGSARPLGRFCLCARRVGVQVPEHRRLRQLGQRRMGRDPATRFAGPLADRPADLRQTTSALAQSATQRERRERREGLLHQRIPQAVVDEATLGGARPCAEYAGANSLR